MGGFDYDIAIIGGGLAGLTTAIQLRKKGYTVVLFEKNSFPFHRVCGEYISFESWDYLIDCGIDLENMKLPQILKLKVSAVNGHLLTTNLDMGGFGISRYRIDGLLCARARQLGVKIHDNCKVDAIQRISQEYIITSPVGDHRVRMAIGSFGKRSNIDVQWKRGFTLQKPTKLNNYIGVKYHVRGADVSDDTIALHNFKNGYCGVSKIEDDKYCMCYLTTAANLKAAGGIDEMQRAYLYQNTYLKALFEHSDFLFAQPLSISQISFDTKEPVYAGIPLIGDACGMITPLCGNGMSMAMHSGKILVQLTERYLKEQISLDSMLKIYTTEWYKHFALRLRTGRLMQSYAGKTWQTNLLVMLMKNFPLLANKIIKNTHGSKF